MSRLGELLRIAPKSTPKLPAWLERLASIGIVSDDPAVIRRQRFTNMFAFASAANTLTHNVVFSFCGLHELAPLITLRRTELALEEQYGRASTLVSTLLPTPIVDRLTTSPEQRIADRIDGLTVLFADLAGFTQAARPVPPEDVVDYLDHMVRIFDDLCEAAGAEKIKTIGDSYMAVGGLDGDARSGAAAVGRLALSMLEAQTRQLTLGNERLALRVGIHTGSATAGIIGDRRFSYDVWGDAVNIASRMESHGQPGRIHVSEAYRAAAADLFDFEKRGPIDVRGVGAVQTWFLAAPVSAASRAQREIPATP